MNKYKLADTQTSVKTLLYIDPDSREIRLHSAYDPQKESERNVDSFKPGRSSLIIVTGLALGYHLNYLRKKFPAHRIIVIEKDKELLNLVSIHNPEAINNVIVVTSSGDLPSIFEEIDISVIRGVSSYIHRPSYLLNKEFYDSFLKDIKEYISSKVSDLLTRFEFEENWIDHIFKNVRHIYSSTPVSALFGKFKGIPGIIVSAGPSLKKNVAQLNNIRDKALIVCVDTALKVLQKYRVTPHIVMTLDSQKYSLKHFLGLENYMACLLADIVSYPRVIELYEGEKILSTTSKYYSDKNGCTKRETTPVWDWVEQFTGPIGDIQSGGSVATSVFDLLLNLGCSQIILVGQDLAYTGREIHCTGTYHNEEWLPKISRFSNLESINQNVIRKRKIKYVEAYNGDRKVISDFVFDIYKYWFKDSAGKVSIPVINATEGGARIENTKEKPLQKLISSAKIPAKSPDKILKQFLIKENNLKKPELLLKGLEKTISELTDLKIKSLALLSGNPSSDSDKEILDAINTNSMSKIIMPFLRKTFVYLTRNPDIAEKKASELLLTDINRSARKIIRMLELCKQNMETIR